MLLTTDIYTLINYVGFVNNLFYGVTVAGLIVLRVQQPSMHRPMKVTMDKSSLPSPQLLSCAQRLLLSRAQLYVGEAF